jgi:hypothetical protein
MDRYAGPVRSEAGLDELLMQIDAQRGSLGRASVKEPDELRWAYRVRETLVCQRVYVQAMLDYLRRGGKSRGSAMCLDLEGMAIPKLPEKYRFRLDGDGHAGMVQEMRWTGDCCETEWRAVRPMPPEDESFERVWKAYRERMK